MAFWAAAAPALIGAAGSIIGGMFGKKGAKQQAKADALALQYAEMARARARQHLSQGGIFNASHDLFPGLLKNPNTGAYHARMPWGTKRMDMTTPFGPTGRLNAPGGTPMSVLQQLPALPRRATGGPVQQNQPYLVGEKGPEVMVPQQPGTVLPNPVKPPQTPQTAMTQMAPGSGLGGGGGAQEVPPGGGGGGGFPSAPAAPAPGGNTTGGAMAGATATPADQNVNPAYGLGPGELATGRMWDYLANPGQVSTTAYERAQEDANRNLNTSLTGIMGGLTGRGIDYGRGGMGQIMAQNAILNAGKQRNEASRDLSQLEETMRREDINTGVNQYLQFLSTVFGLQGSRANAELGASFPSAGTNANPYAGIASGISTAGYLLGKYFDQRNQQAAPAQG